MSEWAAGNGVWSSGLCRLLALRWYLKAQGGIRSQGGCLVKERNRTLGRSSKDGERGWKEVSGVKRMAALAEEWSLAPGYIVAYNHL